MRKIYKDLEPNDKIGKLTILKIYSRIHPNKPKRAKIKTLYIEARCDCGQIVNRAYEYILRVKRRDLISCGCSAKFRTRRKGECYQWKGYEDISGELICKLEGRSKVRNQECNVTPKYLWELYIKQDGKCALTGIKIYIRPTRKSKEMPNTASLDRIDINKGYIEGNVQWVHKKINILRNTLTLHQFINYCSLVAAYNQNKLTKNLAKKLYPEPENTDLLYLA